MTQRRTHGRLRPLTAADRARKAGRNERRDRRPAAPVAPGVALTAPARPKVDVHLAHDHRAVRSFLGRSVLGERRRNRKEQRALEQLAQQITVPTRVAEGTR